MLCLWMATYRKSSQSISLLTGNVFAYFLPDVALRACEVLSTHLKFQNLWHACLWTSRSKSSVATACPKLSTSL